MRSLFTILVVCLGLNSFAQDAYQRYTTVYSVEGSIAASFAGLDVSPTFSIYRNSSKVDIGLNIKVFDIWKDGPGIMGTYLSYKYYPNPRDREFNLYFGYHNIFTTHDKGKKFKRVYDNSADGFRSPDKIYLLENTVGIGFDYQAGNNVYLFNDYSVGVALDWETFHDSETIFEIRSTGLIRLGFGYNIPSTGKGK
ncbi:MAG: hypothetical protein H6601_06580 [Flavobacteriales bacterium]|nr:hypothetical protein [Flavobacteriales bacterium]